MGLYSAPSVQSPPPSVVPLRMNGLSIASLVLMAVGLVFGIIAGSLTAEANSRNYDWEDPANGAKGTGCVALLLYIVAVPLTYCSAVSYRARRCSAGKPCLAVVAWVLYRVLLVDSIALLAYGFTSGSFVPAGWVFAQVFLDIVPWALMFVHAEAARKDPLRGSA